MRIAENRLGLFQLRIQEGAALAFRIIEHFSIMRYLPLLLKIKLTCQENYYTGNRLLRDPHIPANGGKNQRGDWLFSNPPEADYNRND